MPTIYLAGPINGRTDAEARDWRDAATAALADEYTTVLNPMRRDYRGREGTLFLPELAELVEQDKADIRASDVVFVNAEFPSWGTAMEVLYAYEQSKRVVAFCGAAVSTASPWLRYHAEVYPSYEKALLAVIRA